MTTESPIDLIRTAINDDDVLRAVIPTERNGETMYVIVVREQPSEDHGRVIHARTIEIDLEEPSTKWTDNGMWIPEDAAIGFLKSFAASKNALGSEEADEPLIKNGLGAGGETVATRLIETPIGDDQEDDEDDEPQLGDRRDRDVDLEQDTFEGPDREAPETVECHKCGRRIPLEKADNFGGFSIEADVYVCAEGCPDE